MGFSPNREERGSANASSVALVAFNGVTDFANLSHIVDFPQNLGPETTIQPEEFNFTSKIFSARRSI